MATEPKLWIASARAYHVESNRWYTGIIASRSAYVTRQAGLNDIEAQLDILYPVQQFERQTVLHVFGLSWDFISRAFSDYLNDDDRNDDAPEVTPSPEDHGAEVPTVFCELISTLEL